MRREENRIRIRIWNGGPKKPGHVSLQTFSGGIYGDGIYASFYPRHEVSLFQPNSEPDFHTLSRDLRFDPDDQIDLYTLNVPLINEAFEHFRETGGDWSLWGSSVFSSPNARNCAGLTAYLLGVGEIEKLLVQKQPKKIGKYILIGALSGLGLGVGAALIIITAGAATPAVAAGGSALSAIATEATVAAGLGAAGFSTTVLTAGSIGAAGGSVIGGGVGSTVGGAAGAGVDLRNAVVTPGDIAILVKTAKQKEESESTANNRPRKCVIL